MGRLSTIFICAGLICMSAKGAWVQSAAISPPCCADDAFGWSAAFCQADGANVSASGALLLAIGATGANSGNGKLYLYQRASAANASWSEIQQFQPSADETFGGSAYGNYLAFSSDCALLVSGVYTSYESEGGVAVFARSKSGMYSLLQRIVAPLPGDQFGSSVAVSYDACTIAVGAAYAGADGAGAVSTYVRTDNASAWLLDQTLSGDVSEQNLGLATSISASGNVLAVGAARGANSTGGAVVVFARPAVDVPPCARGGFTALQTLLPAGGGGAEDDGFGNALALDATGALLAVGASGISRVFIFTCSAASGVWAQSQAVDLGSSRQAMMGWAVTLSADGSTLLVGANSADPAGSAPAVLSRDGASGAWAVVQSLAQNGGGSNDDFFGWAGAASGSGGVLAVGAEGAAAGAGAVYIFDRSAQ